MTNRWGIPNNIEQLVKERDLNCVYCGISFANPSITYKTGPTWEHISNDIRINGIDNIAICCGSCNASKGSKLLSDWMNSKYCKKQGITSKNIDTVVKEHLRSK